MAGETSRAFSERINMLRVALSTCETLARDGDRSYRTMKAIQDAARHALDRDLQPVD